MKFTLDNHFYTFCSADIAAGGTSLNCDKRVTASTPYYQDKLIWCIQHARKYPIFINFFFIIPLGMWAFIMGVVLFFISVLAYFVLPFDQNDQNGINRLDLFYCCFLIVIPACTGVSSTYKARKTTIRLTYW